MTPGLGREGEMTSDKPKFMAFMSYARNDDHDNKLTRLRESLKIMTRVVSGKSFEIFQDREDIAPGQRWGEVIETALDQVMFLIAIITPSFFTSDACREELRRFRVREEALKRNDLIIPIYYVKCPSLTNPSIIARDEDVRFIVERQWIDWRIVRFKNIEEGEIQVMLDYLADRFVGVLDEIFTDSLANAQTQLREGNWLDVIRMAELAKPICPHGDNQFDNLCSLAKNCKRFADAWGQAADSIKEVKWDDFTALDKLIDEANRFDVEIPKEIPTEMLGEDLGECLNVRLAVEAVRAFGQGDYKRAVALCRQVRPGNLFDLGPLRGQALAELLASEEIGKLEELWRQGDLDGFCEAVKSSKSVADKIETTRQRKRFERIVQTATQLHDAMLEIERDGFAKALSNLEDIDVPASLELSMRVLKIGAKLEAAGESCDLSTVASAEEEFEGLFQGLPGSVKSNTLGTAQVSNKIHYVMASCLYNKGLFTEAKKHLIQVGDYKDSKQMLRLCETWIKSIDHLKAREWDEAKPLLESLRKDEKTARAQKWYRWCRWAKTVVPALEKMASGPYVFDPNINPEGAACPYEILADHLSPSSTMKECLDLASSMDQPQRKAWDMLRLLPNRLAIDFALYEVKNPERARALAERLSHIEEGKGPEMLLARQEQDKTVDPIVVELQEDGGIFLALRNDYDEAIKFLLQEAKNSPHDLTGLHHLGLVAAAKINWLEEHAGNDVDLSEAWEYLIVGWSPVFASDSFWHNWWFARRTIYEMNISNQQIQDVRRRLQRSYFDQLRSVADIFPSLDISFQAEVSGAHAVHAGGGIPLPDHSGKGAVVGFLGAKALGLLNALATWTASFAPTSLQEEGWQRQVFLYFSELAEAAALLEEGHCEQAIATLTRPRCELQRRSDPRCKQTALPKDYPQVAGPLCPCFADKNPAFSELDCGAHLLMTAGYSLLEKAHCTIALEAVSNFPVEIGRAMAHWDVAVGLANRYGHGDELLSQIRETVIGRASVLASTQGDRRLVGLNDAIGLLQTVFHMRWDDTQSVIKHALVNSLLDRAIHISNVYDDERGARLDATQAYSLEPESLRVLIVLCQASLYDAAQLYSDGHNRQCQALVEQVGKELEKAEKLFPGNTDLSEVRKDLELFRETIANREPADLPKLLENIRKIAGDSGVPAERNTPIVEAMIKASQNQFAEAIKIYSDILETNPANVREVESRMIFCYRDWFDHVFASEGELSEEVLRIAREALERFPDADALKEIPRESPDDAEV